MCPVMSMTDKATVENCLVARHTGYLKLSLYSVACWLTMCEFTHLASVIAKQTTLGPLEPAASIVCSLLSKYFQFHSYVWTHAYVSSRKKKRK